jgi:hypothetical protein
MRRAMSGTPASERRATIPPARSAPTADPGRAVCAQGRIRRLSSRASARFGAYTAPSPDETQQSSCPNLAFHRGAMSSGTRTVHRPSPRVMALASSCRASGGASPRLGPSPTGALGGAPGTPPFSRAVRARHRPRCSSLVLAPLDASHHRRPLLRSALNLAHGAAHARRRAPLDRVKGTGRALQAFITCRTRTTTTVAAL